MEAALSGVPVKGTISKAGKQKLYEFGTVAVIRKHRIHYFCVAYAEMNENNQAQGTMDGLWKSLSSLWVSVRSKANGEAVAIPVVGGGLSRLSQVLPAQDAIRLTILSFMFASRQVPVCERLDIVVLPDVAKRLDMLELQAFLKSLTVS